MLSVEKHPATEPTPAEWLVFEQPLTERVRTFLRLEFLFSQCEHHAQLVPAWDSRAAISALLEIGALLARGDVRTEVLKELERCLLFLMRLKGSPEVDAIRLESVIGELESLRATMAGNGQSLGAGLKENEFLTSIRNRVAIPGGTCQFDLPVYHNWLTQSHARRAHDLQHWIGELLPLRDTINLLLALTRESAVPTREVAEQGMFLHIFEIPACPLVRVMVQATGGVYPEISAGRQRVTIHFLERGDDEARARQTTRDVAFKLVCCQL